MSARLSALLILCLLAAVFGPAAAAPLPGHDVSFINSCTQPVWINLQGGPKGECDHDLNADGGHVNCTACSQCPSLDWCNTSKTTGNDTPLCCPGVIKDKLYCYTGQACKATSPTPECCPPLAETGNTAYNCPGAGQTTGCQNTTMTQGQIDALSGYNNASLHLSRFPCNGSLISNGGFQLDANGGTKSFVFENGWQGAFFLRTGCTFTNGVGGCLTGNCTDPDGNGVLECGGAGSAAPTTKGEMNLDSKNLAGNPDWYDVSWVDGFNGAMVIRPTQFDPNPPANARTNNCTVGGCSVGIADFHSSQVPDWSKLKFPSTSNVAGILSACNWYTNYLQMHPSEVNDTANATLFAYCCPVAEGYVNDSTIDCTGVPEGKTCKTCPGMKTNVPPYSLPLTLPNVSPNSANLFFHTCPIAYSYAYNDTAALMTCYSNITRTTSYRVEISCPVTSPASVGVFRPSSHSFYLKNGTTTTTQNWGISTDTPITGDWNGDNLWDVGVFRSSTHTFHLKNGSVTTSQNWGVSTDLPLSGDWNGDAVWDVGVFRPTTHSFYLKNGSVTTSVNWGISTDTPVSGDWNGDGIWDVGVFRPTTHSFYLKNGSVTTSVNWGISTDKPVTGDWNGDGIWDVGIFRPSTHTFYLRSGATAISQNWGVSTDIPVTGKWR